MITSKMYIRYLNLKDDHGEFLASVFFAVAVLLAAGLLMAAVSTFLEGAGSEIEGVDFGGGGGGGGGNVDAPAPAAADE